MTQQNENVSQLPAAVPAPRAAAGMVYTREGGITPTNFDEAWRVAQLFSRSALVPKDYRDQPENCLVAMQMGAEVGLKPLQALQGIAVINGRPSIWGDAMWALVQGHPVVEDAHENFDAETMTATCTIRRKGRAQPYVQNFSKADAVTAGLWGKAGPWTTNPRRMLQMRARAFCARDAVPDVLKGLSVAEEALDIPPEREINPAPATSEPVRGTAALAAARERAKAAETAPEAQGEAPAAPAPDARPPAEEPARAAETGQAPVAEADVALAGAVADAIAVLDVCSNRSEVTRFAEDKALPEAVRTHPEFVRAVERRLAALAKPAKK